MNIKSFVTTSVIALISASAAHAADVIIPQQVAPAAVITAPSFSWEGFYLGAQIGGLSTSAKLHDKTISDREVYKASGMLGGLYGGYNFNLGSGMIFGIDTDIAFTGNKDTRTAYESSKPSKQENANSGTEQEQSRKNEVGVAYRETFKEKWAGATRVRVGFVADRIMPYVAGGVAYAQMQIGASEKVAQKDADGQTIAHDRSEAKKTVVGFTLGAGVDFAVTDNVLLRAEYRYSDFGKKKFEKDGAEFDFKTNDFRVGVAYKF
ncbi:outer membrane protein [Bartonella raoultii]|uniref:Porin family protein n=1 Tax=Bartonella raoultii TaxID=1457020 RepID=A0ABS7I792_9HYPH|nr:outer membrane protein [Bartonella raoultii]MBX4335502.1 porin family protein [Bartonella raoultii]